MPFMKNARISNVSSVIIGLVINPVYETICLAVIQVLLSKNDSSAKGVSKCSPRSKNWKRTSMPLISPNYNFKMSSFLLCVSILIIVVSLLCSFDMLENKSLITKVDKSLWC